MEIDYSTGMVQELEETDVNDALSKAYAALDVTQQAEIDALIPIVILAVKKRRKDYDPTGTPVQFGPLQALQVLAALGMFYAQTPLQIFRNVEQK